MRALPLLVGLVLLWSAGLAAAVWLGLTALADPRIIDAPPRLVLRSVTPGSVDETGLRAALRDAGMDAAGASWELERSPAKEDRPSSDVAVELRAEDTRSLARLPPGLRMERLGGDPAIVLAVPDRGRLTRSVVEPVAEARLTDFAREVGAEIVARRRRHGDGLLELQWVLARHPRGSAAPDARPPRLQAPQLP